MRKVATVYYSRTPSVAGLRWSAFVMTKKNLWLFSWRHFFLLRVQPMFIWKGTDAATWRAFKPSHTHTKQWLSRYTDLFMIFFFFLLNLFLRLPSIVCLAQARPTLWWAPATRCGSTSKQTTPAAPWGSRCPTKVRKLFVVSHRDAPRWLFHCFWIEAVPSPYRRLN